MSSRFRRVHQCLLHDAEEQVATVVAPVLREGLAAGEVVVVHGGEPLVTAVADAVGDDRVRRLVREAPTTVSAAVSRMQQLVHRELGRGARGLRIVGDPDFGPGPRGWADRLRYEAVTDHVLQGVPLWALCPLDSRRVPPAVAGRLLAAHPYLTGPDGRVAPNPAHRLPHALLAELEALPGTAPFDVPVQAPVQVPVEASAPVADLAGVPAPAAARDVVREVAMGTRLPWETADGFVVAVSEVVTNALRHGLPPVRVRVWAGADHLLCAVTDAGPGHDALLAGHRSPLVAPLSGTGLWAARQLVDSLRAHRDADGFTVVLGVSRPGPG